MEDERKNLQHELRRVALQLGAQARLQDARTTLKANSILHFRIRYVLCIYLLHHLHLLLQQGEPLLGLLCFRMLIFQRVLKVRDLCRHRVEELRLGGEVGSDPVWLDDWMYG